MLSALRADVLRGRQVGFRSATVRSRQAGYSSPYRSTVEDVLDVVEILVEEGLREWTFKEYGTYRADPSIEERVNAADAGPRLPAVPSAVHGGSPAGGATVGSRSPGGRRSPMGMLPPTRAAMRLPSGAVRDARDARASSWWQWGPPTADRR